MSEVSSLVLPAPVGTGNWSVGDFNGDGSLDVFQYRPGISGADMYLIDGTELVHEGSWTDSWNGGRQWMVGDFDGDGSDDILRMLTDVASADVFLSNGEAFEYSRPWLGPEITVDRWEVGDFNGDGKDDIFRVMPGTSGAEVYLSNGSNFVLSGGWTAYGPSDDGWFVGDFNGDGRSDIVRHLAGMAGAEVLLSTGAAFGAGQTWTSIGPVGRWTVMDVNGDGKDDLVDDVGNILVSDGSRFELIGRIDLTLDQRVLGVQPGENGAPGSYFIYDSSAPDADSLSVRQIDLTETLLSPAGTEFPDMPRVGYVGTPLDLSFDTIDPAYEVRVATIYDGETTYSDWRAPGSYSFVFEAQGNYLFRFEFRDKETGQLVQEQAGGRLIPIFMPEQGVDLADFSRLTIQAVNSSVSAEASATGWRADVHSFVDLYDHVKAAYEDANPDLDETGPPSLAEALYMTQFVSGMWAYGNAEAPALPGEVTDNEIAGVTAPGDVTADLFINSPIAGCEDYAAVLGMLLTFAGFENRVVLNPSHVLNEVLIGDQWWSLDATFGLATDKPFDEVLQRDTTATILMFSHASRLGSGPLYRERAAEGVHELLAQIDHGIFAAANRYATIDYLKLLPYSAAFTSELDLAGWMPSAPKPVSDDQLYEAVNLDAFLSMTSLARFSLSERSTDVSLEASATDWRQGIADFDALLRHIDDAFTASESNDTAHSRAIFYMEWVSGLWGLGAGVGTGEDTSVEALLGRSTASSLDRAALLGWLLTAAEIENRVTVEQDAAFNEVLIDGKWYTLDATSGVEFEGAWRDLIDTAAETTVSVSSVAGRSQGPLYSAALANLLHETLVRVANGSYAGEEAIDMVNWLATRPFGNLLLEQIEGTAPELLAIRRPQTAIDVAPGIDTLSFEVSFSEAVALQASDFHVTGSTATVSEIIYKGDGKYLVTIAGGNITDFRSEIGLELSENNAIADRLHHALAENTGSIPHDSYRPALDFVSDGKWTSALSSHWYVGDFNGDGEDDIFAYAPGSSGANVHLSDGESFMNPRSWTTAWNGGYNWYVGDFNGDGKDDIFRYLLGSSGADMFLSDGKTFVAAGSWTTAGQGAAGWHIGDFNGDGKDDIFRYVPGASGAEIFLSNGTSFVRDTSWTTAGNGAEGWHVGDFNGDGKDDILRYVPGVSGGEVFLSNGTRFVRDQSWVSPEHGGGWQVADMNGDGLDDLLRVAEDESLQVFLSDGRRFNTSELWAGQIVDGQSWRLGDFDGDGSIDIFAGANASRDAVMLLTDWLYV